jgi:S1-C subfamily serine protease
MARPGAALLTLLPLALLAGLAAGCAQGGPAHKVATAAAPITLSYPYLTAREANVAGYRAMAERAAPAYVQIVILHPGNSLYNEPGGIVIKASGLIADRAGHIVTAAHIARNTRLKALVTTRGGRVLTAEILDVAPERELALLKIRPFPGMRPARFADSSKVGAGDFAFAIGSPRDTAGVVSLGWVRNPRFGQRLDYTGWGFSDAVKIAMEVESGHSGGPVFNRDGEIIGMVAVYELGDTSKTPYVSPRITFAVPARDLAAYVREKTGR